MNDAEMLATLLAMPRLPEPPDRRSSDQIERDAALEQAAEYQQWTRRNPTDAESEYAARRWSA